MMNNNPFTLMYGISPKSIIDRNNNIEKIVDSFINNDYMYTYLITGVRGTGKTVLLRKICEIFKNDYDFITLDLNSQGELITSLANRLVGYSTSKKILLNWSFSINLPYISLKKETGELTNDPEIIIEDIIKELIKRNKKILVSIDEVNNTKEFKKFVNFYQHLIGNGMPIYLLMTGLPENINAIINDKATTFLTRCPKISLEPLDLVDVALEYKNIFNIDNKEAIELANLTNGYAFAFQVLGYFYYELDKKCISQELIDKYQQYLWKNGYNKFWTDLTKNERAFLVALASSKESTKEEIIKNLNIKENNYSQYRKRLIEKGLIRMTEYNRITFILPRFKEFILFAKDLL